MRIDYLLACISCVRLGLVRAFFVSNPSLRALMSRASANIDDHKEEFSMRPEPGVRHSLRFIDREEAFDPEAYDANVRIRNEEEPLSYGQRKVVPFDVYLYGPLSTQWKPLHPGGFVYRPNHVRVDSDGFLLERSQKYRAAFPTGRCNGVECYKRHTYPYSQIDFDEYEDDDIFTVIPAGTELPDGLVLVQLSRRNYCIESSVRCTVDDFNSMLLLLYPLTQEMKKAEFTSKRDSA